MKMCDECGTNPANVHLTRIQENQTHVFHLCEECARKKGISISVNEDAILEEMSGKKEAVTKVREPEKTCGNCGTKLSEFRNKGWLGCAMCYQAFEQEIDELLIQVHGSSMHKGKKYTGAARRMELGDLKRLRGELAIAIKNEQFEEAAALRDAIHDLKKPGAQ
jgi:protein arginine kinase activator